MIQQPIIVGALVATIYALIELFKWLRRSSEEKDLRRFMDKLEEIERRQDKIVNDVMANRLVLKQITTTLYHISDRQKEIAMILQQIVKK